MPGVELSTSACDGHVVVALRGELDVAGAPEVQAAITALVARGRYLLIDMSALDFIDCTSLGALVQARVLAQRGGGDVVLAAPQRHARRILAVTGQDGAFWVQANVAAAVAGIARRRRRYPWRRLAVRTARLGRAAPSRTGTG
jgi:anti-sigma B factor antagonist